MKSRCDDAETYRSEIAVVLSPRLPEINRTLPHKVEEGVLESTARQRLDFPQLYPHPLRLYPLRPHAQLNSLTTRQTRSAERTPDTLMHVRLSLQLEGDLVGRGVCLGSLDPGCEHGRRTNTMQ